MNKLLNEIIEVVEKINKDFIKDKVEFDVFLNQKINIADFTFTCKELSILINELKNCNLEDKEFICKKLRLLLLNFGNFMWCINQSDNLLRLINLHMQDQLANEN